MKEHPAIKTMFDEAAQAVRNDYRTRQTLEFLPTLGEVVRDLQAAGFRASLDVRPRGLGAPAGILADSAIANGTITVDNTPMSFTVAPSSSGSSSLYFNLYLGPSCVERAYIYNQPDGGMKDAVLRLILRAKAESDEISAFSMPEKGVARILRKPPPPATD